MSDGTNDWIVADSEDEDGLQPLQVADQSGLLSGNPFSIVSAKNSQPSVIQTASLISSPARTPQRERDSLNISNASLFTPPPGYQDSDPPHASPSLPRGMETSVPKPKPRPRPVPRKSRTMSTIYDNFVNEDASRASGSLISSASAIPASTVAADGIHHPTTPSTISEFIEDIDPTFSIADRAKTRSRKTQAKKPNYLPVAHDVIELTSDSDLDELSLKPPRKRQKSQDKPVKPKPKPKPKPKSKARKAPSPKLAERVIADTESGNVVVLPAHQEPAVPFQLPSAALHLPSSLPPLPDLSSPPSSPPVMTRKRKRPPLLEPDAQGDGMDVDISHDWPPAIIEPPLFFAQSSSVVPPIDDSHTLEENGDADVIATGSKGKKKDTKPSTRTKGKKKGQKQADEVELDDLVHNSSPDEATAGNDDFAEDDFVAEETPKVTSKKKVRPKPKPATKTKAKPKSKGKAILSESENEEDDPPRAKSPSQHSHLPENEPEESRSGSPKKDSQAIGDSETTKKNPPQSVAAPPKQTPSTSLRSRVFTIKSKSTPMSELIRRVNSQPNSPFANGPTYSLLMKSSRTMLSRIAPLHPNRRTPPPPLPRPPPPKKSKKQIEMEERIEEELAETVEGWSCMTDEERRNLRRARIDAELGYE